MKEMKYPAELVYKELGEFLVSNIDLFDYTEVMENKAVKILEEIQTIIKTPELSDFEIVERIVIVFEKNGMKSGGCHDF